MGRWWVPDVDILLSVARYEGDCDTSSNQTTIFGCSFTFGTRSSCYTSLKKKKKPEDPGSLSEFTLPLGSKWYVQFQSYNTV